MMPETNFGIPDIYGAFVVPKVSLFPAFPGVLVPADGFDLINQKFGSWSHCKIL
jgi:hypothetical protein